MTYLIYDMFKENRQIRKDHVSNLVKNLDYLFLLH